MLPDPFAILFLVAVALYGGALLWGEDTTPPDPPAVPA